MGSNNTIHIPVEGMSCASCAMSIENMLKHIPNIENARVNYANHTATVEYQGDSADLELWRKEISKLGFDLDIESLQKKNP
jgi:Cu2+-exporting ATPase